MRLTPTEQQAIASAAGATLEPGTRVSLFGSRVQDTARGGDIDLLVESPQPMAAREWVARRQAFVVRLYRVLGERRVDVLRNRLARECPDKPELRHAQLLAAVAGAAELLAAYRGWAGRLPANSA